MTTLHPSVQDPRKRNWHPVFVLAFLGSIFVLAILLEIFAYEFSFTPWLHFRN